MMTGFDEDAVRSQFWPKLRQNLARIPFAEDALAAWYCATDTKTPLKVKATLFGALAYFILPFDVIPDVILGLGFTDDLAVLMTALTMIKSHMTAEHREHANQTLDALRQGKPVPGQD
jgi:uncharacterized membrane protein YkvA (DUF1232 family)